MLGIAKIRSTQPTQLRFGGIKPTNVIITGRNLWKCYDYIHQHRMPWIMRADRDFADGKDMVVTSVEFTPVKEEPAW